MLVQVARVAQASARGRAADAARWDELARAGARHAARFTPRQLATVAWSFAAAAQRHAALLRAVARVATRKADDFAEVGISNLVWSFATVKRTPANYAVLLSLNAEGLYLTRQREPRTEHFSRIVSPQCLLDSQGPVCTESCLRG